MTFPALSTFPLITSLEKSETIDSIIRSSTEAGCVQTRLRLTRIPEKWHIAYGDLSDVDQEMLAGWEDMVGYGASFDTWTHPKSKTVYTVRLGAPIKYRFSGADAWSAEFDLEEV